MTRICGYFSLNKQDPHPGLLKKMTESLIGAEWHVPGYREMGNVGLGHVSNLVADAAPMPLWDQEEENCIVFSGVLYDQEETARKTGWKNFDEANLKGDAGFLLELFKRAGSDIFALLNGIFAGAIFQRSTGKLTVFNDRYGLRPLYYYLGKGQFLFASDVHAITLESDVPRQINWKAWSDFFNMGWVSGNDTYFEDIHAFPPGTWFECSREGISMETYWSYAHARTNERISEDDAIEETSRLLRKAMDKIIRKAEGKKVIIPLSGGNDSRMIAACAREKGLKFSSITTRRDSEVITDVVLAERLKAALDIEWEFVDLNSDLYPLYFLKTLEQTSFMAPEHLWFNFMIEKLPHPSMIIDGFAGGNIIGFIRKFSAEEEAKLLKGGHPGMDWYLDGLVRKSNRLQIENIFRERYHRDLVRLCPEGLKLSFLEFPEDPVALSGFIVANRSRRPITMYMYGMLSQKADSHCPFLENDFYDFVQSVPVKFRVNYRFFERLRKEMFPSLAHIPTLKSMAPEKYISKDVYHSFRNSEVIEYLVTLFKQFSPPSEFVDHQKAMNYLFYITRQERQQDHYHRTIFLRNYLVFTIWYNYYFERNSWQLAKDRLLAKAAMPALKLRHLV